MFDWLEDLINSIGGALGNVFSGLGGNISNAIWETMVRWFYETIYNAIADFFTLMGQMGTDIFELDWIRATVRLFTLLAWALFIAGIIVAVFDLAIDAQNGGGNIKSTCLHILMAFMACSMLGTVPIALYKFCTTLQNIFSHDLTVIFGGTQSASLAEHAKGVLIAQFNVSASATVNFLHLLCMTALGYCIIKLFFQNIKRGGILVAQIAVGSLYMFSIPRGNTDGFYAWLKQVIALCLTAFLQTSLMYLGLLTFGEHMLLGLGILLAANEVPKIAQQFGLDTTVRFNMMTAVQTARTAVNIGSMFAKAK